MRELDEELTEVHHQHARRTDIHNREVGRLEQEIQDKEREVFNAHNFYDNVLIQPQRALLKTEESLMRQQSKEPIIMLILKLRILNTMRPSALLMNHLVYSINYQHLHQLNLKVQKNLSKIQQTLKRHSTFQTFIKTLIEIAVEANFDDQGAFKDSLFAFNNL